MSVVAPKAALPEKKPVKFSNLLLGAGMFIIVWDEINSNYGSRVKYV